MKVYSITRKAIYCRNKRKNMSKESKQMYDHSHYLKYADYYKQYALEYKKTYPEVYKKNNKAYYLRHRDTFSMYRLFYKISNKGI